MTQDFASLFSASPALFFECTRILANVANCVLPQRVFEIKRIDNLSLLNITFSDISGAISKQRFER